MTNSVDGLVSGLNTSALIAQLMQAEASQQTALKNRVKTEQSTISAYQGVNTRISSLQTAASALTLSTTWQSVKATSSSDAVVATASAGAPAGSATFDVTQLAKAHVRTAIVSATGAITTGGGLDITIGTAAPVHVAITTDTAQGVADAINAANIGVRAAKLTTDQGTVLELTARSTGEASQFTVSGLQDATTVAATGADGKLTVGVVGAGGYTVTSSTNTFANLISNVTLTATRLQTGVTVSVSPDADAIATKMAAMVDAANAALTEISKQTAYDPAAKKGSPLTGDFAMRQLAGTLLGKVGGGKSGYGDYKQLGVTLTKDGRLAFDKAKFLTAFAADPSAIQTAVAGQPAVTGGLAKDLEAVAKSATDFTIGSITLAIQGRTSMVTTLNKQVEGWDTRLAIREKALQTQFAHLEVALGKMRNQSTWLAGQLGALPTGN